MATAPFDQVRSRQSADGTERFQLIERVAAVGEAEFWRAVDGRNGRSLAVRVVPSKRSDIPRRLAALQRERVLTERIGHQGLLRGEVPVIEGGRIVQAVEPEPAGRLDGSAREQPLAMLKSVIALADTLARAHALGCWHGALTAEVCLRDAGGRVLLVGFSGDGAAAAEFESGRDSDTAAFATIAIDLLEGAGGVTPRARALLSSVSDLMRRRAALPALSALADQLRESLEDTFTWPAKQASPVPAASAEKIANKADDPSHELTQPIDTLALRSAVSQAQVSAGHRPALSNENSRRLDLDATQTLDAADIGVVREWPAPPAGKAAASPAPRVVATALRRAESAVALSTDVEPQKRNQPESVPPVVRRDTPAVRRFPLPVATAFAVLVAIVLWRWFGSGASAPSPDAALAPTLSSPAPAISEPRRRADPIAAAVSAPVTAAPVKTTALQSVRTTEAPRLPAAAAAPVVSARARQLIDEGQRALQDFDAPRAQLAFAAAASAAPGAREALNGRDRAARLMRVAAVAKDARDAARLGDMVRAVQGFSQALAGDPKNSDLRDALRRAQRGMGGDAHAALLAEGYTALGAGRLETARAAFERAVALKPTDARTQRGLAQAQTAIEIRDSAAQRRDRARTASIDP